MATVDEVIEARRSSSYSSSIKGYPPNGTHGIVLTFAEYKYNAGSFEGTQQKGVLRLPLPNQMQDSYGVQVTSTQLGVLGGLTADVASLGLLNNPADLLNQLEAAGASTAESAFNYISSIINNGGVNTGDAAAAALYAQRAGVTAVGSLLGAGVGQGLSSGSGIAVNPHTSLIFEGMNLKQYNMDWQLSPKNQSEMNLISDIIKFIKKRILPTYRLSSANNSISRGLLNYPHMVQLQYVGIDPSHIYTFKPAMISNFVVDYTPHGKVLLKGDNSQSVPAYVNISISFTEAQIWTSEDIDYETGTGGTF